MSRQHFWNDLETADMPENGKAFNTPQGWALAWGTTVPSTVAGYAPGCIFVHTDGSGNTLLYYNAGTATTCVFNAMPNLTIADASSLISATSIEGALQEAFQHIQASNLVCHPYSMTQEGGTALTAYSAGGATPGWQQLSNKETVLTWDGNGTFTKVCANFLLPNIVDDSQNVLVHWLARMAGATDTPVIEHECYFNAGDTDCAGTDDEIDGGTTLTEYQATIAAANVPASPSHLSVIFSPLNGEAGTDETYIYGVWLEFTGKTLTA